MRCATRRSRQRCRHRRSLLPRLPLLLLITTSSAAPLVDRNANCAHWADIGECEANPAFMTSDCAASCADTGRDRDGAQVCAPLVDGGACKQADVALNRCRASCYRWLRRTSQTTPGNCASCRHHACLRASAGGCGCCGFCCCGGDCSCYAAAGCGCCGCGCCRCGCCGPLLPLPSSSAAAQQPRWLLPLTVSPLCARLLLRRLVLGHRRRVRGQCAVDARLVRAHVPQARSVHDGARLGRVRRAL